MCIYIYVYIYMYMYIRHKPSNKSRGLILCFDTLNEEASMRESFQTRRLLLISIAKLLNMAHYISHFSTYILSHCLPACMLYSKTVVWGCVS